jgi:hypothetical protein
MHPTILQTPQKRSVQIPGTQGITISGNRPQAEKEYLVYFQSLALNH